MRRLQALVVVLVMVFAGSVVASSPADATSPGSMSRIVFVSDRDQINGELYTWDLDPKNDWHRLTTNTYAETDPKWQPDGSLIAYDGYANAATDIWTIEVSGANPTNLTTESASDAAPSWSRDGSRIIYVSYDASSPGNDWNIWVMNADGSAKMLLPVETVNTDWSPEW